jgi:hypothetical protein
MLRQPLAAGLTIPLLEGLIRNLALNEELRELAALGSGFEGHNPHNHYGIETGGVFDMAALRR